VARIRQCRLLEAIAIDLPLLDSRVGRLVLEWAAVHVDHVVAPYAIVLGKAANVFIAMVLFNTIRNPLSHFWKACTLSCRRARPPEKELVTGNDSIGVNHNSTLDAVAVGFKSWTK
jgi:hypothetical protein